MKFYKLKFFNYEGYTLDTIKFTEGKEFEGLKQIDMERTDQMLLVLGSSQQIIKR